MMVPSFELPLSSDCGGRGALHHAAATAIGEIDGEPDEVPDQEADDCRRRQARQQIETPKHRRGADDIGRRAAKEPFDRSEEHTSELQSLMRISYAVFCLKKHKTKKSIKDIAKTKRTD